MRYEHMKKAFEDAGKQGLIILIDSNKDKATYFHFSDGSKIGYIQFDKFGEYSLSIEYKPSKGCGTGASFIDRSFINDDTDFKKLLLGCLNYDPSLLTGGRHIFWDSFKEFTNKFWDLKNFIIYQNYSVYPSCGYFIQNSEDIEA